MSYIRCLSNPEGLYVWEDCQNEVWWSVGQEHMHSMPSRVFEEMMSKLHNLNGYISDARDPIMFENGSLYESAVDHKIVIEYHGWQIRLWNVTFSYVYHNWRKNSWKYHARELCLLLKQKLDNFLP